MSNATLIGSNKVSEAEVIQVPAVPFTRTFKPVHHREVINAIRTGISAIGLEVVKSEYVLAREGMQMFGVWDLATGNDELCWSIGLRNSMDKSMALGITAGTRVYVCSNLAFDGEFVELRRHTKGLTLEELEFMAYRAIRTLVNRLTRFQAWHEGLKRFDLPEPDAKVLLVEMLTQSVFPASKFPMFQNLYFGGVYDQTLWGLHAATTQVLKEANLLTLPKKNRVLNAILNQHIEGINAELPSSLGDFYESRARLAIPETTN
ncbi:MAG: hypothetical protein A2521_08540 [Deltaproteobacteria bacterium RIFOXYD12_FULL_57_12]|nr:MAG: hypothetical protein A2521_08540 [Deltaproteobacteria bacterium RIFOXYD12_FULL_57_12]